MNTKLIVIVLAAMLSAPLVAQQHFASAYDELVDTNGNIGMPENFQRNWVFLGAWAVDNNDAGKIGAAGFHNVYTQPGVVEYFNQHGSFPDGAMVIKELLSTTTASMTTGTVSRANGVEGWFVMVKDSEGRFKSNPLWGDGWGWSMFKPEQKDKTVSTDYKTDCLSCHIPAQKDDWIYLSAYPMLLDQDTEKK